MRRRGYDTPFTGKGREEVAIDALNSGADSYLKKGGNPRPQFAELTNIIRQLVGRWEAEEAVDRNTRMFKMLIENISDIVAIVDWDPVPRYVSPSVRRVLGYDWRRG
ncbi:MAG: hypothetical protein ACLFUV_07775 [Methanomassiliicoccales archaeon]